MVTTGYDLFIGIGIGAVSVIVIILIATIIFCKCCVPSASHRYVGRSVSHYAAINNVDAKNYFKPPQHLMYAPIVRRVPQPPVITQEISSSQSARTSVASGGRVSILSDKLSRLSISSNQSGRPSVASDSVLLQKKSEAARLSQSYEDTDTQAITAHYAGRRSSKTPRLSSAGVDPGILSLNSPPSVPNGKNLRFQLTPRTSDIVEHSVASIDPSTSPQITNVNEESSSNQKKSLVKSDSSQVNASGRRQSLLRSPSSKYTMPKYPIIGKATAAIARASMSPPEQGLLSPPVSPQGSHHFIKTKILREPLGAIMPDLYFTDTVCTSNGMSGTGTLSTLNDRLGDELSTVDENIHRLHVRLIYDDHRNDLIINIVEAQCLPMESEELANPYIKIYLRPPIDQKLRQTSVQTQTINPVWDEYFRFSVTHETLTKTTKTLHFYVYNYAHSSRPECVGEAQLRLSSQVLHGCDMWCPINKQRAEEEYLGELLVSLTYLPQAERLNVGIVEARNLKALSTHIEADPIVRLTLQLGQTDKVKRKKTNVKRNTINPKWNEEISFNIPGVSLADSCLEIGVYHHDLIAPDEPLGFLRFENTSPIGSANIAQHSEIIHWCEVINGGQRAACWHLLRKAARIVTPVSSTTNTNKTNRNSVQQQ